MEIISQHGGPVFVGAVVVFGLVVLMAQEIRGRIIIARARHESDQRIKAFQAPVIAEADSAIADARAGLQRIEAGERAREKLRAQIREDRKVIL